MSITSYSELQTATANWMTKSTLGDRIPEFITLAEAELNRVLDCRQMYELDAAFAVSGSSDALPDGFAGVRSFYLNTNPVTPLEFVKADAFGNILDAAVEGVGRPKHYTIAGSSFLYSPATDTDYTATLLYRKTLAALSDDNASNWLLAAHPDCYLKGALTYGFQYLEDDNNEAKFRALFEGAVAGINADDNRHSYGSSPARRVRGFR